MKYRFAHNGFSRHKYFYSNSSIAIAHRSHPDTSLLAKLFIMKTSVKTQDKLGYLVLPTVNHENWEGTNGEGPITYNTWEEAKAAVNLEIEKQPMTIHYYKNDQLVKSYNFQQRQMVTA
jgi:hypothetical protein